MAVKYPELTTQSNSLSWNHIISNMGLVGHQCMSEKKS